MKQFTFVLLLLFAVNSTFAQKDPKAKAVLDKASTTFQSYGTIKADFTYTLENSKSNMKETQKGKISIKGDKYQIDLGKIIQFYDGEKLMIWLKDNEEVQISEPSSEEISNPSQIFTLYQKGFKYLHRGEATVEGVQMDEVEISPDDLNKPYIKIIIRVEKANHLIRSFTTLYKNGTSHTVEIRNIKFNVAITESSFVFDETANPDVDVIDVR